MAHIDESKASAQATVRLSGTARATLLGINRTHGVPMRRLVDMAVQAGLPLVVQRYTDGADTAKSAAGKRAGERP